MMNFKSLDFTKIYSPSKIKQFSQCPKAYHFTYLDPIYRKMKSGLQKMPQHIWKFQTVGKAVHNAITLFYYLEPAERTEENLLEGLKKTWVSEAMPSKKMPLAKWGGFASVEEERESYKEALLMLKRFYRLAETEPEIVYLPTKDFTRSIEDYKNLISPLTESLAISGKFDLIVQPSPASLEVIDFKTGKSDEVDNFQLRFYKVLAEEKFQRPVGKTSFYFLKTGKSKSFLFDDVRTAEIKQEIIDKIDQILKEKDLQPKPSRLCKFCLFKTFCPAQEEAEGIIKTVGGEEYPDDLPF